MMSLFELPATLVGSLAFVFGAIVGSFLNVVALRWETDKGLTFGGWAQIRGHLGGEQPVSSEVKEKMRSNCPYCRKTLAWYELVPVLSFLVQRGHCRHCGAAIGWRYLDLEVVTATVFALIVVTYGLTFQTAALLLLVSLLIIALLIDLEAFMLPDSLTALALVVSLMLVFGGGFTVASPLAGFGIALAVIGGLYVFTRGRGMGLGDVKLAPVLGLTLGGPLTIVYLAVAFLSGALLGLVLIASGRASLKSAVPFGPFLIWGWFVALIWGPELVTWYTKYL